MLKKQEICIQMHLYTSSFNRIRKKRIENPGRFCYNQERQRHWAILPIIGSNRETRTCHHQKPLKIHTASHPPGFSVRERQMADFFMPLRFPGLYLKEELE